MALGNPFVILGTIFASISLYNLVSDELRVSISPLIKYIIDVYQIIFHKPIEAVGIGLSSNVKDLISIYGLFGGVLNRAISPNTNWITDFLKNHEVVHNTRLREISLIKKPAAKYKTLVILFCITAWPIVLYRIFRTPIFLESPGIVYKDIKGNYKSVYELHSYHKHIPAGERGYDARSILLIQVFTIILLFLLISLINTYIR